MSELNWEDELMKQGHGGEWMETPREVATVSKWAAG